MAFDWKNIIGTYAPTIASTLGTPLAGAGVKVLTDILGLNDDATEVDVEQEVAVKGITPEQIVAIKNADHELKKQLSRDGIDLAKLHASSVQAARDHATKTQDHTTPRLITILSFILFTFCLVGTFALFIVIPLYIPNYTAPAELGYLLGTLTATSTLLVRSTVDYYLGSSTGSATKNELLYNSIPSENKMPSSGSVTTGEKIPYVPKQPEEDKSPSTPKDPPSTTLPSKPTTLPETPSKYPSTGAVFPPEDHYTQNGREEDDDKDLDTDLSIPDTGDDHDVDLPPTGVTTESNVYGRLDGYQAYKKQK